MVAGKVLFVVTSSKRSGDIVLVSGSKPQVSLIRSVTLLPAVEV